MLRGDSLAMSEGAPALVEHQRSLMMIEPGAAQQPDGWAQDIPAAMRTPSLEARQVSPLSMDFVCVYILQCACNALNSNLQQSGACNLDRLCDIHGTEPTSQ